jgi:diaminohydroxyphosphoribosylaminopyrimidine deaminase/5-amino-6-(5-phosphoribosylamino)uracil reductase
VKAETVENRPVPLTRALFLAERGLGRTTPNPIVGAVVVDARGVVVGQGAHLQAGGPHAEVVALDAAGERARGAVLHCTLEPCAHTGRTGPCVERIVQAGIARVVVGARDRNPQVAGRGVTYLRAHGVAVDDVEDPVALRQLAPFFTWVTARRPFVIAKSAVSRDGFVGRRDRRIRLSGDRAERFFHRQRALVDAIAVGAGTMLVDDPRLTARHAYRFRPLTRVIVDWQARVPPTARVFSTLDQGPVIMVVSAAEAERAPHLERLEQAGVLVDRRPDRALRPVFDSLAAQDVVTLLVEGGPALHAALHGDDLIDRVQYVRTPVALGDGVPVWDPRLGGVSWRDHAVSRLLGEDELVEFDVHRID